MTSYVNRGYEIADAFRARGMPVVMGGVHPSFMPQEALKHADAVCIGEAELVIPKLLDDLEQGQVRGMYRADRLHPMVGVAMPRYDLLKRHRYVNKTFVQTSRGCHQGCTFCAEPLMNGLKFRYRPIDEVHPRDRQLRLAHHLDQRRGLLRHPGAAEGGHARAEGPRHPVAGRRHLQARPGRPHARAGRRERLHPAEHRLRVDHALHADQRAQAREPARDLRLAGREGALLRHHGVRPVHVRLRRRRPHGVRARPRSSTSTPTTTPARTRSSPPTRARSPGTR